MEKKEFKTVIIKLIPTDFELEVIYSKYLNEITNYLKNHYEVNEYDIDFNSPFCDDLIHKKHGRRIVIALNSKSKKVLIHETVHAVLRWFRIIGQGVDVEDHELLAYWVEYVFYKAYKGLKG